MEAPKVPPEMPARQLAVAELQKRLPRLIFAALDSFPLADGQETGLVVLALRSLPASERLDTTVASLLQDLEQGSHRPPVQQKARQIHLQISDEVSALEWTVNWKELVDFSRLLQLGVPSAIEALGHSMHSPEVLHATDEWWELKDSIEHALAPLQATLTKPYVKACLGAASSLLHKEPDRGSKGAGYQPRNVSAGTMETVRLLAKRVSSDKEASEIDALAQSGDLSKASWKQLLHELSTAAEAAAPLPKLECLELWCQKLRDADYETFKRGLETVDTKPDALRMWQLRLEKTKGSSAPSDSATQLDQESVEAMKHVEGLIPAGSELVFLAQTGSFMYNLQVKTSDMDFALIYQALPNSLLSMNPPRDEFSRHVNQGCATDKKGVVEYTGRELGFFVSNLAKGHPKNVELLFTEKPAHRSWAWKELVEARQCFLTLRCAKQYLGFISQRLLRARKVLQAAEGDEASWGDEFSKPLYHAHHKMLDLGRILQGGCPLVALSGAEREEVLKIRLQRPKLPEAKVLLQEAEEKRARLASDFKAVEAAGCLPAEVDAQALIQWLWSVRVRMARGSTA